MHAPAASLRAVRNLPESASQGMWYLEALAIAAVIYLVVNTVISVSFRVCRFARAG